MEHKHTELDIDVKPQIDYPCTWNYRIIGLSKEVVLQAIEKVFNGNVEITSKHESRNQKYVAINCTTFVQDDAQRLQYFDGLVNHYGILMVI